MWSGRISRQGRRQRRACGPGRFRLTTARWWVPRSCMQAAWSCWVCRASAVMTAPVGSMPSRSGAKAGISLLFPPICRWARTSLLWVIAAIKTVAVRLAVREPRSVLPSTAMAFRPAAGALRSWRKLPTARSSVLPFVADRTRRTVVAWGGRMRPVSGSGRKPSRVRTSCGASATHSPIAVIEAAPARTAAAAVVSRAVHGWRMPRRARGSGTAARKIRRSAAVSSGAGSEASPSRRRHAGMREEWVRRRGLARYSYGPDTHMITSGHACSASGVASGRSRQAVTSRAQQANRPISALLKDLVTRKAVTAASWHWQSSSFAA